MLQTLGKFTVAWEKRGPIHYACWFTRSSEYFKCVKGLRGSEVSSHNKTEYGVVTADEYIPFGPWGELDKDTQDKFLELPEPFFVSQFLCHAHSVADPPQKKVFREPLSFRHPLVGRLEEEQFSFPETVKN